MNKEREAVRMELWRSAYCEKGTKPISGVDTRDDKGVSVNNAKVRADAAVAAFDAAFPDEKSVTCEELPAYHVAFNWSRKRKWWFGRSWGFGHTVTNASLIDAKRINYLASNLELQRGYDSVSITSITKL